MARMEGQAQDCPKRQSGTQLSAYRPIFRHAQLINIRCFSEARARFIDPTITNGPQDRHLDICFGGPNISSVIVEPGIASKLVGKEFAEGEKAEVPLLFFHKTRHFAKGKGRNKAIQITAPALTDEFAD
ncbi:MAG: hypothetical protein Q9169_006202 [Polycauliona sp. 2 TL-2023]